MIRVRWIPISFVMWQRCFPHIGMFSVLHRECINLHEGRLRNKMHLHSTLKGCFFCVKRFWPITRVENNSQEKFTILHVPHIGFLCYTGWDQILLYGRWLESKDEYMCCFMKFCQLLLFKPIRSKYYYSNWDQILLYGRWLESKDEYMQGHPTAIFGKISVWKTIWELEFSEHLL